MYVRSRNVFVVLRAVIVRGGIIFKFPRPRMWDAAGDGATGILIASPSSPAFLHFHGGRGMRIVTRTGEEGG